MKKNDKFIGKCLGYSVDGLGIVKEEGFVFFVKDMIADEEGEIVVTSLKKNYGYGKCLKHTKISEHRQEAVCTIYKSCGGCQLQHFDQEEQRNFKRQKVKDCFRSIAKIEVDVLEVLDMENPFRYRNKVQVPIQSKDREIKMGFYRNHTQEIIEFEDCRVQTELSNQILKYCKKKIQEYQCGADLRHILVKHAHEANQVMIVLVVRRYPFVNSEQFVQVLLEKFPQIESVIANINTREGNVILSNKEITLSKKDYIIEELDGLTFKISSKSFYQINPRQTAILYRKVMEFADLTGEEIVVDLYCGTGTIGLFASSKARKVIGIEIVEAAIKDAKENAIMNGTNNVEFICADAKEGARELVQRQEKVDVVIVDPPRKGCDESTLASIIQINPNRIIYVSCNPATLARDVKKLSQEGYQVNKVQPVDMFPMTNHVETVCLLSKLNVDHHIEVDLNMDELDLTSAESKAAYDEIKAFVLENSGLKVTNLYIAQVKDKMGIKERENFNVSKKADAKVPQCPADKEKVIIDALRHFNMIN